jgi:hypothetical protein
MTQYVITLDKDDNGTFEAVITGDVLALHWFIGMQDAYDAMPADSTAQITLDNISGDYAPERTPLQPGQRLQIRTDAGLVLFTGFIQQVIPEAGANGQRRAIINVAGAEQWLKENRLRLPTLQNVRADTVIGQVLDACILRRDDLVQICIIDRPGNNIIGLTIIAGENVERDLDVGKSRFVYVAEREGVTAWRIIQAVTAAERGAFYLDRTGQAVFRNRHAAWMDAPNSIALSDDMHTLDYTYGDDHINRVEVRLIPRSIGAANSVLWALDVPQRIRAGATRRFAVQYIDAAGEPAAALFVDPRIDYSAALNADGTADRTGLLEVVLQDDAIEVRNRSAVHDLWLMTCIIRGTPLSGGEALTVIAADKLNAHVYGLRTLRLNLTALNNVEEGDGIATYELQRRSQPRGIVHTVTVYAAAHPGALNLTLFDRVTITETHTGHNAVYVIIAEEHHVTQGGAVHRITWTLRPVDMTTFFIINTSNIDSAAQLLAI